MGRYPAVGSSTQSESFVYGQAHAMGPNTTQPARDDAGDSFRPPPFGSAHEPDWAEQEEQESNNGLRVSSLLFLGTLLALGFFGYRHYVPSLLHSSEIEPTFGAAAVELPPEADAVEVADPVQPGVPVEPQNAADMQAVPVAPAVGPDVVAPAAPTRAPVPAQHVAPARPPASRAAPLRSAPAQRAASAPARAPSKPAVRRPMRMMPREQNAESLPDNPY